MNIILYILLIIVGWALGLISGSFFGKKEDDLALVLAICSICCQAIGIYFIFQM